MKFVKIALIVAVVAIALFAAKQTGILEIITDIKSLQDWIASFGVWGYAVFIAAFVFACVFLLPGSAFTIVAGIVFGPIKGGILALFSGNAWCGGGIHRGTFPTAQHHHEKVWR